MTLVDIYIRLPSQTGKNTREMPLEDGIMMTGNEFSRVSQMMHRNIVKKVWYVAKNIRRHGEL